MVKKIAQQIFLIIFLELSLLPYLVKNISIIKTKQPLISPLAVNYIPTVENSSLPQQTNSIVLGAANEKDILNLLLLGVDGRKGDNRPRCDAIHILSYHRITNTLEIINIPRGTMVNFPTNQRQTYLANACHYFGIEKTKEKIEEVADRKIDYVIKTGFSQTLGILRILGLPTTPTLQFLRNRSLPRGDYQRTHNQGLFIKDFILNHFEFVALLPKTVRYLAFSHLETDLPLAEAEQLFQESYSRKLHLHPENITLITRPETKFVAADLHFNEDEYLQASLWQNNSDYQLYQKNLQSYLDNLLGNLQNLIEINKLDIVCQKLQTPFSQKLYLQIEDDALRQVYNFQFLEIHSLYCQNKNEAIDDINNFLTEMELSAQTEMAVEGKNLLQKINSLPE